MWVVAGVVLLSYAVQTRLLSLDDAALRYGMVSADVWRGHWQGLVTSLFIHGGWAHVGMNAAGALAFGAPVARLFGRGLGALGFFVFFLVCGVLANLGYAALHPHDLMPLVGASGAVSGLFGGASRLIENPPGLSSFASRAVVGTAAAWIVVNVVFGLAGIAPGMGVVKIAWEAHIFGYFAGLLLIGPAARLFAKPELPSEI
jgi:membrane associated rhomboid family serine protease